MATESKVGFIFLVGKLLSFNVNFLMMTFNEILMLKFEKA